MRHKVKKRMGIGKDAKHRKAMLCNLATFFLSRGHLETTVAKAKLLRPFVERLITRARVDNLHNRRMVYRYIRNTKLLKRLFLEIAKEYVDRPGGYTRIRHLGFRKGDGAPLALIQLVAKPEVKKTDDIASTTKEVDGIKVEE